MKNIKLLSALLMLVAIHVSAQTQTYQHITINYESPWIPKAGSAGGLVGIWNNDGLEGLEVQVWPNRKFFAGFAYAENPIINTGDWIINDQLVYARVGLRLFPFFYATFLAGNFRTENTIFNGNKLDEWLALSEIYDKDRDFTVWGPGFQFTIPYPIFNKFRFAGGASYIKQLGRPDFTQETLDGVVANPRTFFAQNLMFQFGIVIPLTEYRSVEHENFQIRLFPL